MIYLEPSEEKIPGFCTGDLLDDEANRMCVPEFHVEEIEPVFIYQEHIIAHTHTRMSEEEILKNGKPGVWKVGKIFYGQDLYCAILMKQDFRQV